MHRAGKTFSESHFINQEQTAYWRQQPEDLCSCKRSPDIWAYWKYKNNTIGQSQPRVVIYINFVELESPMLHAKFQDHMTFGSGGEDF